MRRARRHELRIRDEDQRGKDRNDRQQRMGRPESPAVDGESRERRTEERRDRGAEAEGREVARAGMAVAVRADEVVDRDVEEDVTQADQRGAEDEADEARDGERDEQ